MNKGESMQGKEKQALVVFQDKKIRRVWHDGEWYFSVVDIVGALTESEDARKYWNKLSQRLREEGSEVVTNCHQLKLLAEDGKMRAYWITGRDLEKLHQKNICLLHPDKGHKFLKMISSVKEKHYSPLELRNLVLSELYEFKTTKELALKFNRSELRVSEVLQELKVGNKIDFIRENGTVYWILKDLYLQHIIHQKRKILRNINKSSFTEMGQATQIYRKRIPKELEKLKMEGYLCVSSGKYKMTEKGKQLLLGCDESGSLY